MSVHRHMIYNNPKEKNVGKQEDPYTGDNTDAVHP